MSAAHFTRRPRSLLIGLVLAGLWLSCCHWLPLEESVNSPFGPMWFVVKMTITYLALAPALFGWGTLGIRFLAPFASYFGAPEFTQWSSTNVSRYVLWTLTTLLLGIAIVGTLIFTLGLVFTPNLVMAMIVAGSGYFLTLAAWRRQWLNWRAASLSWLAKSTTLKTSSISMAAVLAMIVFLRISSVYFFQGHEDAYLYHLAASESWLRLGQTGVYLSNIFSGYALAGEHYYLFIKLLVIGNAEQNALAQLSHAIIGYGCFTVSLLVLSEPWLKPREQVALSFIALHTAMIFHCLLPKNDAYLAASVLLAVTGLCRQLPLLFLAGAATAMVMKPTAGFSFAALGLAAILATATQGPRRWTATWQTLRLLMTGGGLMILFWLPYGWRNAAVTGDPFFPLLTEIFHTPYAPGLGQIISEAEPFKISFLSLLRSYGRLLIFAPVTVLALISLPFSLWHQDKRLRLKQLLMSRESVLLMVFITTGFFILQLFTGEFGKHAEPRHYLGVLGPLIVLSAGVLVTAFRTRDRQWLTAIILGVVGISVSNLDVSVRDLYRSLSGGNITATFIAHKPLIQFNHDLDSLVLRSPPEASPLRVFADTVENTSYFLAHSEFWHKSMTYPAWGWQTERLSGPQLLQKLRESQVSYVVTEDQSPLGRFLPSSKEASVIEQAQTFKLWRLH